MRQNEQPIAEKFKREHVIKNRWHKIVTVLAAVVVFCTTYALILPAITWERSLICEIKEHTHSDSCYQIVETEGTRELICTEDEHEHTADCRLIETVLICSETPSQGHTHSEGCYGEDGELICALAESAGHTHDEDCYTTVETLVCEKNVHKHNDNCYSVTEPRTENVLVCELPEHTHTSACFDAPPAMDDGYYCEKIAHVHNELCYFSNGSLRCTVPEHTHTDACEFNPQKKRLSGYLSSEDEELKVTFLYSDGTHVPKDENGGYLFAAGMTYQMHLEVTAPRGIAAGYHFFELPRSVTVKSLEDDVMLGEIVIGSWEFDEEENDILFTLSKLAKQEIKETEFAVVFLSFNNAGVSVEFTKDVFGAVVTRDELRQIIAEREAKAKEEAEAEVKVENETSDESGEEVANIIEESVNAEAQQEIIEGTEGTVSVEEEEPSEEITGETAVVEEVEPSEEITGETAAVEEVEPSEENTEEAAVEEDEELSEAATEETAAVEEEEPSKEITEETTTVGEEEPSEETEESVSVEGEAASEEIEESEPVEGEESAESTEETVIVEGEEASEDTEETVLVEGEETAEGIEEATPGEAEQIVSDDDDDWKLYTPVWAVIAPMPIEETENDEKKIVFENDEALEKGSVNTESMETSNENDSSDQSDEEVVLPVRKLMKAAAPMMLAAGGPINFGEYINGVQVQKKVGDRWETLYNGGTIEPGTPIKIGLNYRIPGKTLSDSQKTISYQLPNNIEAIQNMSGDVKEGAKVIGRYTIDSSGYITITFNDDYVRMNNEGPAGRPIDGKIELQAAANATGSGGSQNVHFQFNDEVSFDMKVGTDQPVTGVGDINVQKSITSIQGNKVSFKAIVTSRQGTFGPVMIQDWMSGNLQYLGNLRVNGTITDFVNNGSSFQFKLPQMYANQSYVIEYDCEVPIEKMNQDNWPGNTVSASSLNIAHGFRNGFGMTLYFKLIRQSYNNIVFKLILQLYKHYG